MVKITDITNQKNKNKFNLFVDGEFYSGILKETAVANNFFVGKEIDENLLADILIESETKQAFEKASNYLATRLHSKFELRMKLIKKEFSSRAIELALNRLEDYGYVNDKEFAKAFAAQNSKLSRQMISQKLSSKGVSKDIIAEVVCAADPENEFQKALTVAEKYLKGKDKDSVRDKLYISLARKGFDGQTIKNVINKLYNTDIDY
ncbi:MAG: RecX family transcriptional regulator [Clostridia bacterium]|nr:RecX family transcriptional regulator [Clostridia bacterium]